MINSEISQLLVMAVMIAFFPVPIMMTIVILLSPQGEKKAWGFLGGWLIAILGLGFLALVLLDPEAAGGDKQPAAIVSWLRIVVGLGLIGIGVKKAVKNLAKNTEEPVAPQWLLTVKKMKMTKIVGMGAALVALNPKNLILVLAATSIIVPLERTLGEQIIYWLIFSFLASLGVITPLLIMVLFRKKAEKFLFLLKKWLEKYNTVIIVVLCFLIGGMMLVKGLDKLV